jgi:hypothetical protein
MTVRVFMAAVKMSKNFVKNFLAVRSVSEVSKLIDYCLADQKKKILTPLEKIEHVTCA